MSHFRRELRAVPLNLPERAREIRAREVRVREIREIPASYAGMPLTQRCLRPQCRDSSAPFDQAQIGFLYIRLGEYRIAPPSQHVYSSGVRLGTSYEGISGKGRCMPLIICFSKRFPLGSKCKSDQRTAADSLGDKPPEKLRVQARGHIQMHLVFSPPSMDSLAGSSESNPWTFDNRGRLFLPRFLLLPLHAAEGQFGLKEGRKKASSPRKPLSPRKRQSRTLSCAQNRRGEAESVAADYPDQDDKSQVSYSWEGLSFPYAPSPSGSGLRRSLDFVRDF
ncbi:hypothetical protein K438DRAFT_1784712 [Mycena galopus ATCC 62051]|nr:hypothetical protein K438DRAFT_1784712 [Mycena galopus ATCC 62051]